MSDEENMLSDIEDETPEPVEGNGMPVKGPYANQNPAAIYPILLIVELGIGYLIAWGVYALDPAKYDAKVQLLKLFNLGYLYIAALVAIRIPFMMQIFVAVQRKNSKAPNPDQYIFKTMLADAPYVRLETAGHIGRFNRSQRAIDNMRETFPGVLMTVLLGGFVFPEATLVAVIVLFIGLTMFSAGYIYSSRGPGMIVRSIAAAAIAGFVLFSAIQTFL